MWDKTSATTDGQWRERARRAGYSATGLAAISGISLRTLQRHFKAHYGLTVSDWLKTIRMQEAVNRVRAGHRVKQVAMDLGYKQLSHFSRQFKMTHGSPPRKTALTRR